MALIAEAFGISGGVPAKVLADRMACLKGGVVANVVIPTPDYVRLAGHYGFTPDFCHAHDPQSKGIVENLVGYAQRDLAVPLLTEATWPVGRSRSMPPTLPPRSGAPKSMPRCIRRSARSPTSGWSTERNVLRPLPSLRLDIGPAPVLRKVDRLSCVRFASARYSVPTRLIGVKVRLVSRPGGC